MAHGWVDESCSMVLMMLDCLIGLLMDGWVDGLVHDDVDGE